MEVKGVYIISNRNRIFLNLIWCFTLFFFWFIILYFCCFHCACLSHLVTFDIHTTGPNYGNSYTSLCSCDSFRLHSKCYFLTTKLTGPSINAIIDKKLTTKLFKRPLFRPYVIQFGCVLYIIF